MATRKVQQEAASMNPLLEEKLVEILLDTDVPRSGLSKVQLKTLALELAAAMPPVEPKDHFDLVPLVAQIGAVLESALEVINNLPGDAEPRQRMHAINQVSWLIDAGITINEKLAHETGLR